MTSKPDNSIHSVTLEYYDIKPDEPHSSVMGSLDYDFSISRYPEESQLRNFVETYILAVNNTLGVNLFNCRFERPRTNVLFVNFYIYLRDVDPNTLGIFFRIEDDSHDLIKIFYEVLENNEIPAIDTKTNIQFIVKNFEDNSKARAINLAWHSIHTKIKTIFPEVVSLSSWNYLYVFIKNDIFEETIVNIELLEKIKQYCYTVTKKHDIDNVWNSDNFYIRIDNWKNYEEIGGQHYFNSASMFDCLIL